MSDARMMTVAEFKKLYPDGADVLVRMKSEAAIQVGQRGYIGDGRNLFSLSDIVEIIPPDNHEKLTYEWVRAIVYADAHAVRPRFHLGKESWFIGRCVIPHGQEPRTRGELRALLRALKIEFVESTQCPQ
jgi:hypothetical protein